MHSDTLCVQQMQSAVDGGGDDDMMINNSQCPTIKEKNCRAGQAKMTIF